MKAILLVRVSSDTQSLDEQTKQLIQYALEAGYDEDNQIIIEDTESAIKLSEFERKGLNTMKANIEAGDVNAVFVWELSRLIRGSKVAFSIRDYLVEKHIQLYCYSPKFKLLTDDLSDLDDNGSLLFALWVQMAESEMKNKKARFHRSKIRNAKTGKYSGGFKKFGYKVNAQGYYEIDEPQAEIIKAVFNAYESGVSIFKLNKELVELGTTNSKYFVQNILLSDCYAGLSDKYGMQRQYPQIISTEQFNHCREIAKTNNKKLDKTDTIYYCKKLIKCLNCGTQYIGMKSGEMYVCYGKYGKEARYDKSKACNDSADISIHLIDSLVWDVVKERETGNMNAENIENIKAYEAQILVNQEKISASTNKINSIEARREKNNTMYFNNQIKESKYLDNAKAIDAEVKELNNLIVKCTNDNEALNTRISNAKKQASLLDMYNDKAAMLEALDNDAEIYEIIKQHIKEINIIKESNTIKIINIYYTNGDAEQYRVLFKARPARFELNNTYIYRGAIPAVWQVYPVEVVKRIRRKSQSKAK